MAWHRRLGQAPTLDEVMRLPSTNERWAQDGHMGALPGAPKVTVILNLFKREVSEVDGKRIDAWRLRMLLYFVFEAAKRCFSGGKG